LSRNVVVPTRVQTSIECDKLLKLIVPSVKAEKRHLEKAVWLFSQAVLGNPYFSYRYKPQPYVQLKVGADVILMAKKNVMCKFSRSPK